MTTEWRVIPGFESYEASSDGVIRRRFPSTDGRRKAGTILPGAIQHGYRYHALQTNSEVKRVRAHRIIATTFLGPPPSDLHHAAHKDGNRLNNKIDNLKWATHRENEDDKIGHGTILKGEDCHLSRITESDVLFLRSEFARGANIRSLANAMNMTFQNIWCIVHRKTWAHVA